MFDATVERCCMLRLGPAMSSIFIGFQRPVESAVHWMVQLVPSLNTDVESGAVGTGSARARLARRRVREIVLRID